LRRSALAKRMLVVGNGLAPFRFSKADVGCRERPCAVPL